MFGARTLSINIDNRNSDHVTGLTWSQVQNLGPNIFCGHPEIASPDASRYLVTRTHACLSNQEVTYPTIHEKPLVEI